MAEEEKIRKHAKHALQALTDKTKKWKDRIKDFLWEVFIILVAVNITLWFHDWSQKRHEQAQVKEFLISTRESLVQDTINIRSYINTMNNYVLVYYDSVLFQIKNNKIDAQYIDSLYSKLGFSNGININYGIYQSFSSANNLRLIENRKLSSDIISLYSALPDIDASIDLLFNKRSDAFEKYIAIKIGFDNKGSTKLSTIIHQPEVIYTFRMGKTLIEDSYHLYDYYVTQIDSVIKEIDQELKAQYNYKIEKKGGN